MTVMRLSIRGHWNSAMVRMTIAMAPFLPTSSMETPTALSRVLIVMMLMRPCSPATSKSVTAPTSTMTVIPRRTSRSMVMVTEVAPVPVTVMTPMHSSTWGPPRRVMAWMMTVTASLMPMPTVRLMSIRMACCRVMTAMMTRLPSSRATLKSVTAWTTTVIRVRTRRRTMMAMVRPRAGQRETAMIQTPPCTQERQNSAMAWTTTVMGCSPPMRSMATVMALFFARTATTEMLRIFQAITRSAMGRTMTAMRRPPRGSTSTGIWSLPAVVIVMRATQRSIPVRLSCAMQLIMTATPLRMRPSMAMATR